VPQCQSLTRSSLVAGLRGSAKGRPRAELLCEYGFRPLAQLVVVVLLRLRVPPPAVVVAQASVGFVAAGLVVGRHWLAAAILLQVKTLLDNADGQLARASGRVTELGRYLDTEADLVVNAALFGAVAYVADEPWLALAAFLVLTFVLSVDYNLADRYREVRGEATADAAAGGGRVLAVLERVYRIVFAPQDRLVRALDERRLDRILGRSADRDRARLAYHDGTTLSILANLGLSTQLVALGICLAVERPQIYLWLALGCGLVPLALQVRREHRARR
jgi:phosphatidylglycerophosphate synthase